MVNCGACGKFLALSGAAVCGTCAGKFHRACLALPEKVQLSKDWACPNCKKATRRGDNSQTPVRSIYDNDDGGDVQSIAEDCTGSTRPKNTAAVVTAALPGAVDQLTLSEVRDLRNEIFECVKGMREFRSEMDLIRDSFAAISGRMDGIEQRLQALEQRGPDLSGDKVAFLEQTITGLKLELNERDQDMLLTDLEISQMPENKGENAFHSVCVLATRLGVPLEERDVVYAERVGARPDEAGGRPRRMVVRLARRCLRDELLRAARVRRAGLAADTGPRIYINERLTRLNRQLFHRAREECRRLQWRFCWTKRGRIYARQGEGQQVFQLRSEMDISRVFGQAWVLGWWMCKTVPYVQGLSVAASVYSLVAVSLDRFLAIWWPLKCQITKRRARLMIVLIWIFAILVTSPWVFFFDLFAVFEDRPNILLCLDIWPNPISEIVYFITANLIFCYILPMVLITMCYILIWIKVWRRAIPTDTQDAQMERMQQKSKVKVVKMLVAVVILFVLSWFPLYSIFARIKLGGPIKKWEEEILPIVTPLAQWLGSSNSCINPILYAFFNKKYRKGFMAIIKSRKCCGRLRYYETIALQSSSTSTRKSWHYNNNNHQSITRRSPPVDKNAVSFIFNHTGV